MSNRVTKQLNFLEIYLYLDTPKSYINFDGSSRICFYIFIFTYPYYYLFWEPYPY